MSGIAVPRIGRDMQTIVADRVWQIYQWCAQAYLHHGRVIKFPAGTDPYKTYQWRYLTALARRFNEWDFDDDTAQRFIATIVRYGNTKGLLHKGLAILHQKNLLEICYDEVLRDCDRNIQSFETLGATKTWLASKPTSALLARSNPDSLCNLTQWYLAGKVPELYIALSRSCWKALRVLEASAPNDRVLLPPKLSLYLLRTNFLANQSNLVRSRELMGIDWRS